MKTEHDFVKRNAITVIHQLGDIDWSAIADEILTWEVGTKGYITITKRGKKKSRDQLGYYYAAILPEAFKNFKTDQGVTLNFNIGEKMVTLPLSLESVDLFFKLNYASYNEGEYKDKAEMNMAECAAFEDYCIKWLATWRNVHVPSADREWRSKE